MKKIFFLIFFMPYTVFAEGKLTKIDSNVTLYSEYYPNPNSKFKGTIIFENGSGTDLSEWTTNKTFFQCIHKLGSVFLYDRNGLGKSLPDLTLSNQNPITAKLVSNKLFTLLNKQEIKPPYLLIAHSYGSIYAGYFTLKNPDLIKALLLVDPVPRDFHFAEKMMEKYQNGINEGKKQSVAYIYKHYKASEAEVIYQLLGFEEAKQSIKQLGSIPSNIPVFIISSTQMEREKPIKEDWYNSQKQWLNKNKQNKIIKVNADHFIQIEKPQIVCDQVKNLMAVVK